MFFHLLRLLLLYCQKKKKKKRIYRVLFTFSLVIKNKEEEQKIKSSGCVSHACWYDGITRHVGRSHLCDTLHPSHSLTLWYLALFRSDQASLHQCGHGDVPARRAFKSSVTGATVTQVIQVTDVSAALFHHRHSIVRGPVGVI